MLIDLSPALSVAFLGASVALLPAALVAWRGHRTGVRGWPAWQRALTVATLFLTLDLVVFGAFTRLTDSGLGCPDWPGCYGQTSPIQAHVQITAAHAALPSGPVSLSKAWIEMVHRYLATAVGALITALMLLAWVMRRREGGLSPWWATATFVWVCAQGAFGALTVTFKLMPIIVTTHLLGALLGVALLTAQTRSLEVASAVESAWRHSGQDLAWRRWAAWLLALVAVQAALGGWVSTNYAVLACTEWPLCQRQWWPDMDFRTGFSLFRKLGENGQGGYLSFAGLTAIHMVHRLVAFLVLAAMLAYGWALKTYTPCRREGSVLLLLAAWQVLSGLSNVVLGWPLAAALAHTLGAALLVWLLTRQLALPRSKGLHATAGVTSAS
jgi:cytochrome c oxidase assembly protein subunit 15